MKQKFTNYLKQIKVPTPIVERVSTIVSNYSSLCPENILDILVSEYQNNQGERVYESLYLFSDNFLMEAKSFTITATDDFDILSIKDLIYIDVKKRNFDFITATEESRISVEYNSTIPGTLKASGKNCEFLSSIMKLHLVGNLRRINPRK